MRHVLLDAEYYPVSGDIHRRNINPRAPRFDIGTAGYAAFTQANVEAWKGMRGGIGHKYQERGNTEECYWSEGLDGSHHGGIILGPKVTTAGTFGKAPIKMIDFGGKTYAIGDDLIAEWSGSAWTSRDTGVSDPIDAIVVTDSTDTYLVVSNATAARYTTDGSSWSALTGCKGYLAVFNHRLVGFYGQTVNESPAKNIDGTWITPWDVGAYLGTAHKLFTAKSQTTDEPLLCLATTEGMWTIDPWVRQIYPYLTLTGHTDSGRVGMFWNSYIWVSTGPGIKKISPGIVTDVGPDQEDGLPSGYQGAVYDMTSMADGSWMVYCVNGGSTDKSSIFKRHGTIGGNQQVYTCGCHEAVDSTDTITAADASDQSTSETLLNEIKADYNTHRASTTYHVAADGTNAVTSANASNLATAITLVNEIKADYNAHRILSGVHLGTESDNDIASADATDLATVITLANEIKVDFNLHLLSAGGAIACVHYSPSSLYTNGRLWWGEGTGIKYCMMPDLNMDVTEITGYEFVAASGKMIYSIFRPLEGFNKLAIRARAVTKGCDAAKKITVYYWSDNDAAWQTLGELITSPQPTALDFASAAGLVFRWIKLGIEMETDSSTVTPELRSLELDYDAAAKRLRGWTLVVPVTQHNAEAIIDSLHTTQDKDTLVLFYPSGDSDKTSYRVKITNLAENIHWDANQTEGQVQVTVEELLRG